MFDIKKYFIKDKKIEKPKNIYTPSKFDRIIIAIKNSRENIMIIREPSNLSIYKEIFENYLKLIKQYRSLPSEFKEININDSLFDKKCNVLRLKLNKFYNQLLKIKNNYPAIENIPKMKLTDAVILANSKSYELSRIDGKIQELSFENTMDGEAFSILNYAKNDKDYEELEEKLDKSGLKKLSYDIQDMMLDFAFLTDKTVRIAYNSSDIIYE